MVTMDEIRENFKGFKIEILDTFKGKTNLNVLYIKLKNYFLSK